MTGSGGSGNATATRSNPSATTRASTEHVDVSVTPAPRAGERFAHLDNLKTILIAGIIAAHAVMGYANFGSWTYQDVREATLSPVGETIFVVIVASLGAFFMMALFFLISGLLTQDSLARKGPSSFVSDRLWRLGLPFAIYTLVVWPAAGVRAPRAAAPRPHVPGSRTWTPTRCSTTDRCGSWGCCCSSRSASSRGGVGSRRRRRRRGAALASSSS